MLKRLFKYKWMIGLVVIGLGLLAWFIKTSMKEAVAPMYHEIIVLLNTASQERGIMNNEIIQVKAQYNALDSRVTKGFKYQNDVLRVEVKSNAEQKLSKEDFWKEMTGLKENFWNQLKEVDERMDTFELSSEVHKNSSLHNGKSK